MRFVTNVYRKSLKQYAKVQIIGSGERAHSWRVLKQPMDSFKSGRQPVRSEYLVSVWGSNTCAENRKMKMNSERFPVTNWELPHSIRNKGRSDWCRWRQTHLQHLAAAQLLIQMHKGSSCCFISPSEHEAAFILPHWSKILQINPKFGP